MDKSPLPAEQVRDTVDDFFAFIQEYCTGEGFKRLKEICLENKDLKERVKSLEIAYHENISALTKSDNRCRSEHERYEDANRAKEDALKRLNNEEEATKNLNARVGELEDNVKTLTTTSKSWEKQTMDSTTREEVKAAELKKAGEDMEKLQDSLKNIQKELHSRTTKLDEVQDHVRVVSSFSIQLDRLSNKKAHMYVLTTAFTLHIIPPSLLDSLRIADMFSPTAKAS
jgi:chromosome segregation ATPase